MLQRNLYTIGLKKRSSSVKKLKTFNPRRYVERIPAKGIFSLVLKNSIEKTIDRIIPEMKYNI
tara:strand:- start:372 stop:560 length:189 start_codon:yes stop_codon:yes gene_type:complete